MATFWLVTTACSNSSTPTGAKSDGGGLGSTEHPSNEVAVRQVADAYCIWLAQCFADYSKTYKTTTDCEDAIINEAKKKGASTTGTAICTQAEVDQCCNDIKASPCASTVPEPASCKKC